MQKVTAFHEANPTKKEQERLKAKVFGLNSQLDALVERLSEIPKGVSAAPIFKQMQKLEELKSQHQEELKKLKASSAPVNGRVIDLYDFQALAKRYRALTFNDLTVDQKKRLLKRFIQKIEVGVDSVKIHFIKHRRLSRVSSCSSIPPITVKFPGVDTLVTHRLMQSMCLLPRTRD